MQKKLLIAISIFAGIGLLISIYSFLHYHLLVSGELCNINEAFSCDIVNRGSYSKFWGVPVSLIGIFGYLLVGVAALVYQKQKDTSLLLFLLLAATGGLGFSLYLTSIEAFVLHTWCLLCIVSQITMVLMFVTTVWLWFESRRKGPVTQ